jgi:hypothetical protein
MSTAALMIRSLAVLIVLLSARPAQAQCTGTSTTQVAGTRTLNSITITGSNTSLLYVEMPLQGSGIPTGTVVASIVNASTFTMSAAATQSSTAPINLTTPVPNADWQTATVPAGPPTYTSNVPPTDPGTEPSGWHCGVCPSQFTVDICGNEYARMYLCAGNVYTISLCTSANNWNSTISITGLPPTFTSTDGFTTYDDDGCGTSDGHASLTYTPQTSGLRAIRILSEQDGNPCIPDHALCGTLTITCSGTPEPPPYDDPCGALPLPVNTYCSTVLAMNSNWSTTTTGVPPASCGTYAGNDVWASLVMPASGALVVQMEHVTATDMAMALYASAACTTAYVLNGTRTEGFTLVTGSNTTGMVVGMIVTGTGIPAGTTVASIVNATTFTLSNAATASASTTMQVNIWTEVACNADLSPQDPEPFIILNDPALAGQTLWVRLFPQGSPANGGSFELCAFEPTPNFIDNPCTAALLPVTPDCTPLSANTELATATSGPPEPNCGNGTPINDVWFTVQIPQSPDGMGVEVQLASAVLDDAVMAVYTASDCTMDFTEVACSDPEGSAMPVLYAFQNGTTIVAGTVLYVRVWNNSTVSGPFQICARPSMLPVNDEPCGALMLEPIFGCLPRSYPMSDATITGSTAPGVFGIPPAPCGLAPERDIWFTVVVPANGELIFDTEATDLSDAALALYTAQGSCAAGSLDLQPIGSCATEGSSYDVNMPALLASGLTPGDTLYLRVWQESGPRGDALICAHRTDEPSGNCIYTLELTDLQGNGWNGNSVELCVNPPGPSPDLCSTYTVAGDGGTITVGANLGSVISLSYMNPTPGNQGVQFRLLTGSGASISISSFPPTGGTQTVFIVNADCNEPPLPFSACYGADQSCSETANYGLVSTNAIDDLNETNQGCLLNGEEYAGIWWTFDMCPGDPLAFTLTPNTPESDVNWALWGPLTWPYTCPMQIEPIRCSRAATSGGTGLMPGALDESEDQSGDGWLAPIQLPTAARYLLYFEGDDEVIDYVTRTLTSGMLDCFGFCLPLGATGLPRQESVSEVYPNPAHTTLTLQPGHLSTYSWELLDARGSILQHGNNVGVLQVPVIELPGGFYVLRTVAADGDVQDHKWMKE